MPRPTRPTRQLNLRPSSQHSSLQPSINFISYSNHLRKKEDQEMKVLEKIDYNYEQMPIKKNDNDMFLFLKQKGREETLVRKMGDRGSGRGNCETLKGGRERTHQYYGSQASNQLSNSASRLATSPLNPSLSSSSSSSYGSTPMSQHSAPPNYQQIDTSAVVIKGRLIYLKQQTPQILSNDHLLSLLHQNKISNKEYLTGNQKQIIQKINNNQSMKENQIIKDYILRNMSEQNNGEVLVMERFHQVKARLFD